MRRIEGSTDQDVPSPAEKYPDEGSFDVLIVGARIAGSTLAALLGDVGLRVLLVDSATFPSSTLSTHFFRGNGLGSVLHRLEVLEKVLALGPPKLIRQYLHVGRAASIAEPPQSAGELGYNLSVRREPLDTILLDRARESVSVTFTDRTRVTKLIWEEGRVAGARIAGYGSERSIRARLTVGADGRQSFLAHAVQAKNEIKDPPSRAIYYRYVRGFPGPNGDPPDGPEFSILEDEMAYVFPSDAGVTCIALSVNLAVFNEMKSRHREAFGERVRRHHGIADRFEASEPIGNVLGQGPRANYVRVPVGPGWALVGDAGMHQDPWSGMGMDMAGNHAELLAEAIISDLSGNVDEHDALTAYHEQRNQHGLESYRTTVQLAKDLRQLVEG